MNVDISHLLDFLPCATPEAWLKRAAENIPLIMIDHANCEKKAAATAMHIMFKYTNTKLLEKMSQLAREELLHFEQVVHMMNARGIEYIPLSSSRYARELRTLVRTHEPAKLIDTLVAGAFIEARSCERFAALAQHIESSDAELARYYTFLLKSESRHFEDYLGLAYDIGDKSDVDNVVSKVYAKEQQLIISDDTELRFHSGIVKSEVLKSAITSSSAASLQAEVQA